MWVRILLPAYLKIPGGDNYFYVDSSSIGEIERINGHVRHDT